MIFIIICLVCRVIFHEIESMCELTAFGDFRPVYYITGGLSCKCCLLTNYIPLSQTDFPIHLARSNKEKVHYWAPYNEKLKSLAHEEDGKEDVHKRRYTESDAKDDVFLKQNGS